MSRTIDPSTSRRRGRLAFLAPLTLAFLLLGASSAFAITRNAVLARAQTRVDNPVPYSQTSYYGGYRTDCSGYVSMCWSTGTSWNTRSFYNVTHTIKSSELKPGDAMLKPGYHIRLFYGWLDDAHTQYVAYESASSIVAGCRIHSLRDDLDFGYKPARYDRIQSSPTPSNILRNPTFDVWAESWDDDEWPVWWLVEGDSWQQLATHRKDAYYTAKNALKLFNPSEYPEQVTDLSQTTKITPGASYRLTGRALTTSDPSAVALGLTYLAANGTPLAESWTTGDACGVDGESFARMSVQATAPADAVVARVTVRLAAGGVETSSGVKPGTRVTVDDISLTRPMVTVGISASRTTAYNGTSVTLNGSVTPTASIGAPAVLYVQKPGSSTWAKASTSTIFTSGSAAAWKAKYAFTGSMPRGVYRFKTAIPAIPGYLGATSSSVSVQLR